MFDPFMNLQEHEFAAFETMRAFLVQHQTLLLADQQQVTVSQDASPSSSESSASTSSPVSEFATRDGCLLDKVVQMKEKDSIKVKSTNETSKHVTSTPMNLTHDESEWCLEPTNILRYLKASDWKPKKAIKMMQSTVEWRRQRNLPFTRQIAEPPQVTTGTPNLYLSPYKDRQERPIIVMTTRPDTVHQGMDKVTLHKTQLDNAIHVVETAIQQMDQCTGVEQMVLLIDASHFKISEIPVKIGKHFIDVMMKHYPERLGLALVMNCPTYFAMFFNMVSAFLSEKTRKKIVIVPREKNIVDKTFILEKYMDLECVEKRFGGTSEYTFLGNDGSI